jgi:hypothetical protein
MSTVMVKYKVKPDQVEHNKELVRAVYGALQESEPEGLRYATFQLDDGVSFIHLLIDERTDGSNPLGELPAFKEFQRGIPERMQDSPVVSPVEAVGSFGLLDT